MNVMVSENTPCWIVWSPQAGTPTVRHLSEQEAINEAERLAQKCPGRAFIVFESVCLRRVTNMQCENMRPDWRNPEVPF